MEAYWLAGIKGKKGSIYNISGKKKLSVKDFLSKLILYSKTNPVLIENKKLIPLRGPVNKKTLSCRENGTRKIANNDKHGFKNLNSIYDKKQNYCEF